MFFYLKGEEYLKFLAEEAPVDLLFLDIKFEDGMDGIAVGKELRADLKNEITQIVYISGLESYAMQLFQNRPMDFLLKPVKQGGVTGLWRSISGFSEIKKRSIFRTM